MSNINVDDYWGSTDVDHVWFNTVTQEYVFCDEAAQFNGPFPTKEQAKFALDHYILNYL